MSFDYLTIIVCLEESLDRQGKKNFEIIFNLDGAPLHYDKNLSNYLDNNFRNCWIGLRGPGGMDISFVPLKFFLWGYLKQKLFETEPASVNGFTSEDNIWALIYLKMFEKNILLGGTGSLFSTSFKINF